MQRANVRLYGEAVTYRPAAGGSLELRGIFRDAHAQVSGDSADFSSVRPTLDLIVEDMGGLEITTQDDEADVRGVTYYVADQAPDGEGIVSLHLHRVST